MLSILNIPNPTYSYQVGLFSIRWSGTLIEKPQHQIINHLQETTDVVNKTATRTSWEESLQYLQSNKSRRGRNGGTMRIRYLYTTPTHLQNYYHGSEDERKTVGIEREAFFCTSARPFALVIFANSLLIHSLYFTARQRPLET